MITNDSVRVLAASSDITCANVTVDELKSLHEILSEELKASDCYHGSYRMDRLKKDRRYMTCSTSQWKGREAVSFNRDGFIGMAGWADSTNIKPIRDGVIRWIGLMRD